MCGLLPSDPNNNTPPSRHACAHEQGEQPDAQALSFGTPISSAVVLRLSQVRAATAAFIGSAVLFPGPVPSTTLAFCAATRPETVGTGTPAAGGGPDAGAKARAVKKPASLLTGDGGELLLGNLAPGAPGAPPPSGGGAGDGLLGSDPLLVAAATLRQRPTADSEAVRAAMRAGQYRSGVASLEQQRRAVGALLHVLALFPPVI